MGKFFGIDSPLMRFLSKITDLILLNILFVLCCVPVVTAGAATTALYYMTLKMIRDEESGILRGFFTAFRSNFRQATVLWLGQLTVMAVLVMDLWILARSDLAVAAAMNTGVFILMAAMLLVSLYLYPLLAKFENSIKNTLKNACLMAVGSLPQTILMGVFCVACGVVTFYNGYTLSYGILFWVVLGFAAVAFGNSVVLSKVFEKYIPESARPNAL